MTDDLDRPEPADGPPSKRPPRFHGPHTWALAKEQYLTGDSARTVCERHGIGFHALKRRMRVEGWSRRAYAAATDPARQHRRGPGLGGTAEPPAFAARAHEAEPPPDLSAAQLAQQAVRRAAQALADGRTADARALSAMAESLSRTAAREPRTGLEVILRAIKDPAFRTELFRIDPDDPDDPDIRIKRIYWGRDPDSDW
jgi:hypothetical protein